MQTSNSIWIEIRPDATHSSQAGIENRQNGVHALFALRFWPKPFKELLRWKQGFSNGTLLTDGFERLLLFLKSQHPGGELEWSESTEMRTLCLRCWHLPGKEECKLVIVGKVWAEDKETACQAAQDYCQEIQALFPYDYELEPILSQEEFWQSTGREILIQANPSGGLHEIKRAEFTIQGKTGCFLLMGKWQSNNWGTEQIWRAIAAYPQPILFNILLRPTYLTPEERILISEMARLANETSIDQQSWMVHEEAGLASNILKNWQTGFWYPYILQIHLVSPLPISPSIIQAIGSALTHGEKESGGLRYRRLSINDTELLDLYCQAIYWLEPILNVRDALDPRIARLRYLAGSDEVSAVFRFPYPLEGGIPGVSFMSHRG